MTAAAALLFFFLCFGRALVVLVACYPSWSSSTHSFFGKGRRHHHPWISSSSMSSPLPPRDATTTPSSVVRSSSNGGTTSRRPAAVVVEEEYDDSNVVHVSDIGIKIGPDLNSSKPPLDSKLYRQILLPNGMRCVLIQDLHAMRQGQPDLYDDDSDSDSDDDHSDSDSIKDKKEENHENNEDDEEDDDDTGLRDAAAALVVGAGSAYDPLSCQGMAHFLEHLLFMGSKKYPVENEYEAYVAKHGGSDNAYTEWEYTVYSLHIPQEYLWGGLDRLAQHFVSPLLLESAVDRELNSIESEFRTNAVPSDECRREQLLCATSRIVLEENSSSSVDDTDSADKNARRHYLSQFAWGNLHSLRTIPKLLEVDPLKELRRFFNQYYYAANMRLVVMGAYPLDYMQQKVVEIFAPIPALPRSNNSNDAEEKDEAKDKDNKPAVSPRFDLPISKEDIFSWNTKYHSPLAPFGSPLDTNRSLGKIFRIVPIKERHALTLTWPLLSSSIYRDWRSKPTDYVAHLLGHEASGSLLSYLRHYDLATACHAGVGDEGVDCSSSHALFTLTIVLSMHGLREWRRVVQAVYQYIGMLRYYSSSSANDDAWPEWIFDELRQMQDVSYRFGDEESPDDTVQDLCERLAPHAQLPPDRLLDGPCLLWEFDAAKIKTILDECLTPANARIDLQSSEFGKHIVDRDNKPLADKEEGATLTETIIRDLVIHPESKEQDIFLPNGDKQTTTTVNVPPPQVEPMFGTKFWCSELPPSWIEEWTRLCQPTEPSSNRDTDGVGLHLPPPNPFVPERYDLKKLPDNDAHHVLLNSSLKLCIPVGKRKEWFAATVVQYNRKTNALLLSFEDEEEKWHVLDDDTSHGNGGSSCSITKALSSGSLDNYEGTMDKKKTKFRIVSLATTTGSGGGAAVRKFGDASDEQVLDGTTFPPIPPPMLPSRRPKEILGNRLRLWHVQDRHFHRPVAELRLEIVLAIGGGGGEQPATSPSTSPLTAACADLLVDLVADTCLETAYLASVCELESAIEATCVGWNLRFHGFDDKLLRLAEMYLNVLGSFRRDQENNKNALPKGVKENRFEACLEVLRRRYKNSGVKASKLCSSARVLALRPTLWSAHAKLAAIQDLTVDTFMQTVVSMFESSSLSIEALYHGNVDEADAHKAKDLILSSSIMGGTAPTAAKKTNGKSKGKSKKKIPSRPVLKIPSVKTPSIIVLPSREPNRVNTAVEVYIQVGKDNLAQRIMIDFLVHMMDEPLFDQVRTKEQYGYSVYCDARWSFGIMGFVFGVVSNVKSADDIVERVDKFLRAFRQHLIDMSQEDYLEHQAGLATQKLDAFDCLSDETDSYWSEITDGRYEWQVWREEAICLRGITKEEALAAFDEWLRPDQRRAILAVQVVGDGGADVDGKNTETGEEKEESFDVGQVVDDQIAAFHKLCKNQTWGRVNSKLF